MFVVRRLFTTQIRKSKYVSRKKDPGIYHRKSLFLDEKNEYDENDLDNLESDFMTANKSYKEHFEELELKKEKIKYLIVKQKYFKEKYPNFLTWQDNEQIPLPEVIEQIVKAKWTKKNRNKILNHDKTVVQNWNDFKAGKLNHIPEELKRHLQKFSNRKLNPNLNETVTDLTTINQAHKEPVKGSFAEIISSYQKLKSTNEEKESPSFDNVSNKNDDQNYVKLNRADKRMTTFKALQAKVEEKIEHGKNISVEEKLIYETRLSKGTVNSKIIELNQEELSNIVQHKYETVKNKVGSIKRTSLKDLSHLIYPDEIIIPEKIYKKGNTYKLNDCYYDSDGLFLYRVPGMS
ncbi:hypothetical protein ABEB36_005597 [Hypothenemus hampei]|uniref:Neurite outgrowth-associated protein n=1 Tax=Hypothenemus hampei TaxID=57062 RepID=A0ABD1EZE9_HYPHA